MHLESGMELAPALDKQGLPCDGWGGEADAGGVGSGIRSGLDTYLCDELLDVDPATTGGASGHR